jgi:vacuolar-type H+-ATPase subunit I/STV1
MLNETKRAPDKTCESNIKEPKSPDTWRRMYKQADDQAKQDIKGKNLALAIMDDGRRNFEKGSSSKSSAQPLGKLLQEEKQREELLQEEKQREKLLQEEKQREKLLQENCNKLDQSVSEFVQSGYNYVDFKLNKYKDSKSCCNLILKMDNLISKMDNLRKKIDNENLDDLEKNCQEFKKTICKFNKLMKKLLNDVSNHLDNVDLVQAQIQEIDTDTDTDTDTLNSEYKNTKYKSICTKIGIISESIEEIMQLYPKIAEDRMKVEHEINNIERIISGLNDENKLLNDKMGKEANSNEKAEYCATIHKNKQNIIDNIKMMISRLNDEKKY